MMSQLVNSHTHLFLSLCTNTSAGSHASLVGSVIPRGLTATLGSGAMHASHGVCTEQFQFFEGSPGAAERSKAHAVAAPARCQSMRGCSPRQRGRSSATSAVLTPFATHFGATLGTASLLQGERSTPALRHYAWLLVIPYCVFASVEQL